MIPTPGRIVEYTLTEYDADAINKRRADAIKADIPRAVVPVGNRVDAGETYPLVIVRTWGSTDGAGVNGQVLLDGDDTFWATSRTQGDGPGYWREFPRV